MDSSLKKLSQALIDLDKKAEEFDEALKNLRSEIHSVLWDLMEPRKENNKQK